MKEIIRAYLDEEIEIKFESNEYYWRRDLNIDRELWI